VNEWQSPDVNRSQVLPIVIAAMVVLAGCNALTGDDDTETDTPTVTPVDVPTDEPTATPVPVLAPGLTGAGVVDAADLADAHGAALADGSFTYVSNHTVRYGNGTLRSRLNTTAHVANATGPFYSVRNATGPFISSASSQILEVWSDGERVFTNPENSTSVRDPSRSLYSFRGRDQFIKLFNALETRVVGQETRNGTELYRIRATSVANPEYLPRPGLNASKNPRNISFRALVDSEGIVRSYHLAYTATDIRRGVETTKRLTQSLRYTDIGSTVVERPDWYEAANHTTTAVG